MEKNLPLASGLRVALLSSDDRLTGREDTMVWEVIALLCTHPSYVHGGSMGEVCSVCGLMPPDADVLPANSADLDLAADLVRESHPSLALRIEARSLIVAEVAREVLRSLGLKADLDDTFCPVCRMNVGADHNDDACRAEYEA